jgi:DNA-binding LacI/PurR family transcriptional regulator/AraC-like DNA-binding protein/signal transduction histidine kinase
MAPPVLALVCASIHTGASRGLWNGFVDAALARGADVLCLPVGRIGAREDFEASRNRLFELATARNADALACWTTSLSGCVPEAEIDARMGALAVLPFVGISRSVASSPLVAFDAYRGMKELVAHLVDVHGHERLAFARGPASHVSAEQRYRAYCDLLAERGLPYRPELVTEPLPWNGGREAALSLVGQRNLKPGRDFTAFVAASDLMAFGAMEVFLSLGARVPEDLALAGFNDSRESALASPALSTVAVDFRLEGATAADLLFRSLAGERVPATTILPAELRLRRSCGCPSADLDEGDASGGLPVAGPGRRALLGELAVLLGQPRARDSGPLAALLDALAAFLRGGDDQGSGFLSALEAALDRTSPEGLDPAGWQRVLSLLRRRALAGRPSAAPGLEEAFHRGRALASEASRRAETYAHWLEDQEAERLRAAGAALLASHDLRGIAAALAEALPRLGIPSGFLVLCREGEARARLVAAAGDPGGPVLPEGGLVFDPALVLPEGCFPGERNRGLVVEPLFFREEGLGWLVLEIGPRDGTVYEELRAYVSSALHGAALFEAAEEARRRAEEADGVKTRLLANLSRELCEPLERIISASGELEGGGGRAEEAAEGIGREARRQLGLIEDLLDLSRSDIGELELELRPVDLGELLPLCLGQTGAARVELDPPARLPLILADARRLSQALAALALAVGESSGAACRVTARVEPGRLVVSYSPAGEAGEGIAIPELSKTGLGLSLARRILVLHEAELEVRARGGYTLSLPLPSLGGRSGSEKPARASPGVAADLSLPVLSRSGRISPALVELAGRLGLSPRPFSAAEEAVESAPALGWDLDGAEAGDWELAASLRGDRRFSRLPLLVLGAPSSGREGEAGCCRLAQGEVGFFGLLEALFRAEAEGPVFVLAAAAADREYLGDLAAAALPARALRLFADAAEARKAQPSSRPALVLADAAAALAWRPGLADPPLLALVTGEPSAWAALVDLPGLCLLPRDLLPEADLGRLLARLAAGEGILAPHAAALVRRALLYLAERASLAPSRGELAAALGVNGDYLGRLFQRELGLSPWEFLGRYRVLLARRLLEETEEPLAVIAAEVGLGDQAYFSRVFRKFAGEAALDYRRRARRGSPRPN